MIRKELRFTLTTKRVRQLFDYDAETDGLTWRVEAYRGANGKRVNGSVEIYGRTYYRPSLVELHTGVVNKYTPRKTGPAPKHREPKPRQRELTFEPNPHRKTTYFPSALLTRPICVTPPKPKPPLVLTKTERELAGQLKSMGVPRKNIEQHIRGLRDVEHRKNYWRPTQRKEEHDNGTN